VIYISADGQNLMPLDLMGTGSRSLDLSSYSFAAGTYTTYVQAVGKPTFINHMSGGVKYTVQATTSGGGSGAGSSQISMGIAPAALNIAVGKSSSAKLTVTPLSGAVQTAVMLSCSNLPVGVSCSFSPASVVPGSKAVNSTLTVSLSSVFAGLNREVPGRRREPGTGLLWSGFGVAGLAIAGSGIRRRRLMQALSLLAVLGTITILTACGGGSTVGSKSVFPATPTSNAFTFTVDGDSGNSHSSVSVTVTVN
jgi:hypothetical protein